MFCRHCGQQNDENSYKCVACGAELHAAPQHATPLPSGPIEQVPNYLVFAILCTAFCCLPFGIVAIVYSSQVSGLVAMGNIEAARDASKKAKIWCLVSFGSFAAVFVMYFLFVLVMLVIGIATQQH